MEEESQLKPLGYREYAQRICAFRAVMEACAESQLTGKLAKDVTTFLLEEVRSFGDRRIWEEFTKTSLL